MLVKKVDGIKPGQRYGLNACIQKYPKIVEPLVVVFKNKQGAFLKMVLGVGTAPPGAAVAEFWSTRRQDKIAGHAVGAAIMRGIAPGGNA